MGLEHICIMGLRSRSLHVVVMKTWSHDPVSIHCIYFSFTRNNQVVLNSLPLHQCVFISPFTLVQSTCLLQRRLIFIHSVLVV